MTSGGAAVQSKIQWRILLPFTLLIIFSSLDRVNIGMAAIGTINADLGLTPR
ncbi:MAG: hypothetical protein RL367_1587 [Pseudomonadota bacterium]|jgi:ABC-type nitrate/sulfonate/bicarbonate transport system permease component